MNESIINHNALTEQQAAQLAEIMATAKEIYKCFHPLGGWEKEKQTIGYINAACWHLIKMRDAMKPA